VRWRGAHTLNRHRLVLGVVLFALVPLATEVSGLTALAGVTAILAAMIAFETRGYGADRAEIRHRFHVDGPSAELLPDELAEPDPR
jgi:hypothetical protein